MSDLSLISAIHAGMNADNILETLRQQALLSVKRPPPSGDSSTAPPPPPPPKQVEREVEEGEVSDEEEVVHIVPTPHIMPSYPLPDVLSYNHHVSLPPPQPQAFPAPSFVPPVFTAPLMPIPPRPVNQYPSSGTHRCLLCGFSRLIAVWFASQPTMSWPIWQPCSKLPVSF